MVDDNSNDDRRAEAGSHERSRGKVGGADLPRGPANYALRELVASWSSGNSWNVCESADRRLQLTVSGQWRN